MESSIDVFVCCAKLFFYLSFHIEFLLIHLLGILVIYVSKFIHTTVLEEPLSNKNDNIIYWNVYYNLKPNFGMSCIFYTCNSMFFDRFFVSA